MEHLKRVSITRLWVTEIHCIVEDGELANQQNDGKLGGARHVIRGRQTCHAPGHVTLGGQGSYTDIYISYCMT